MYYSSLCTYFVLRLFAQVRLLILTGYIRYNIFVYALKSHKFVVYANAISLHTIAYLVVFFLLSHLVNTHQNNL